MGLLYYLFMMRIHDVRSVDLLDFAICSGEVLFLRLDLFSKLSKRVYDIIGKTCVPSVVINCFVLWFWINRERVSEWNLAYQCCYIYCSTSRDL